MHHDHGRRPVRDIGGSVHDDVTAVKRLFQIGRFQFYTCVNAATLLIACLNLSTLRIRIVWLVDMLAEWFVDCRTSSSCGVTIRVQQQWPQRGLATVSSTDDHTRGRHRPPTSFDTRSNNRSCLYRFDDVSFTVGPNVGSRVTVLAIAAACFQARSWITSSRPRRSTLASFLCSP